MHRVAYGVSWTVTGQVALRGSTFLTTIVIARMLGTTGFGELGMVQGSVAMLGVMAGFGLGSTTTKYVAQYHRKDPAKASRVIVITSISACVISGTCALLVVLAADWIAHVILLKDALSFPLKVGSLLFFVLTLDGVALATLRGFESFRRLAVVNLCKGVMSPVIAVPFVFAWGLGGAVAALVVSAVLGLVLTVHMVVKECADARVPIRFTNIMARDQWDILWRFSFPAMLAGTLVVPPMWIGQAILVRQPQGYMELGFFSVANQWMILLMFLPSVLGAVLMPIIASDSHTTGADQLPLFGTPLVIAGVSGALLVGVCILLADPILSLYGAEFAGAKSVFVVVMITTLVAAINEILYQALLGMGAPYRRLVASSVRACVFVGCVLVLVPKHLALGLAISRLVAASVYLSVQLPMSWHRFRVLRDSSNS